VKRSARDDHRGVTDGALTPQSAGTVKMLPQSGGFAAGWSQLICADAQDV
jgi:hypothetical protein